VKSPRSAVTRRFAGRITFEMREGNGQKFRVREFHARPDFLTPTVAKMLDY
jgi:hypothetical protein